MPNNHKNSNQQDISALLQRFNKHDQEGRCLISLQTLLSLLRQQGLQTSKAALASVLRRIGLQKATAVSFDEFLSVLSQLQESDKSKADFRIVEYIRLLNQYRKRCEEKGDYQEAKKAHLKIKQVKEKQARRQKVSLRNRHEEEVRLVQQKQRRLAEQFKETWQSYQQQFEQASESMLVVMQNKHKKEQEEYQRQLQQSLYSKMKYSKYVLELRAKQQKLVKLQKYQEAQEVRTKLAELQEEERAKRLFQVRQIINNKMSHLIRQQAAAMKAALKKIERDKALQLKQKAQAAQLMTIKKKNAIGQLQHKFQEESKKTIEGLKDLMSLLSQPGKKRRGRAASFAF